MERVAAEPVDELKAPTRPEAGRRSPGSGGSRIRRAAVARDEPPEGEHDSGAEPGGDTRSH